MAKPSFSDIFRRLKKAYPTHDFVKVNGSNPYKILISCILSLRTQDQVSLPASLRLFKVADTPKKMASLTVKQIEKLVYPVGFYRNKSKQIHEINKKLLGEYKGNVPNTLEKLLEFKGVGRKTANLVLSLGFDIPAICVDIHVHRISNRLGWVKTNTPEETEFSLMDLVPKRYWIVINHVMVNHGQQVCRPTRPKCEDCMITEYCAFYRNLRKPTKDAT